MSLFVGENILEKSNERIIKKKFYFHSFKKTTKMYRVKITNLEVLRCKERVHGCSLNFKAPSTILFLKI